MHPGSGEATVSAVMKPKAVPESLQDLQQRNADLQQQLDDAGKQHELLISALSHDLRTPLMTVLGFTDLLIADLGAGNQTSALQYLQTIRQAAAKQSKLFEEVLAYSRLTSCEIKKQKLDFIELAKSIVERLAIQEPQRKVSVEFGPTQPVQADKKLFSVALEALIANAWKFTAKTAQPKIEISAARQGDATIYCVRDNGAGFDPKQQSRLFQPFKRLHNEKEYPGSGMGLATAAAIVGRHGGRIWAESARGSGSSFYIALK